MTKAIVFGVSIVFVLLLFAARGHGDTGDPDQLSTDNSFPLPPPEQTPLTPAPPGAVQPHQPFTPYESGPIWTDDQLTPEELEVVDRGRDVSGWAASQNKLAEAVKANAQIQAAMIAQQQMGLGDLGDTGVVP